MLSHDGLVEALRTLGQVLEVRSASSRILVAGGSSLLLLGFIDRPTADVDVLGRVDLIHFKLYAAVDQSGSRMNKHLSDLKRLAPSADELLSAAAWTRTHDPSDGFLHELRATLHRLGVEKFDA